MKKKSLVGWIEQNNLLYLYDGWQPKKRGIHLFPLFRREQKNEDGYYWYKVRITIEELT